MPYNSMFIKFSSFVQKLTPMKKIAFVFPLVILFMLSACNFSAGIKQDLGTGLSIKYNGFVVDELTLVDSANQPMSNNIVKRSTEVAIVAKGLGNFALKDEKAYPGLTLSVTNKEGVVILHEVDFLAGNDGYTPADASVIRGTITIGDPMQSGETYHVKMHVWDKNKTDNQLTAEVDLAVE